MKTSIHLTIRTLAVVSLALAGAAAATDLFNVNFATYANGTTYSSTFVPLGPVVTTDTGLVGTGSGKVTGAIAAKVTGTIAGGWSAVVQGNMLKLSATNIGGNGGGIRILKNQAAPSSAQTWFVQFDYTRLATTSGILGVNFFNASGVNMLGHPNNGTFYPDQFVTTPTGWPKLANGTYLLRLEVDSGTTVGRAYVNNVLVYTFVAANTNAFGGLSINFVSGATDFLIGNISGGIVGP